MVTEAEAEAEVEANEHGGGVGDGGGGMEGVLILFHWGCRSSCFWEECVSLWVREGNWDPEEEVVLLAATEEEAAAKEVVEVKVTS